MGAEKRMMVVGVSSHKAPVKLLVKMLFEVCFVVASMFFDI